MPATSPQSPTASSTTASASIMDAEMSNINDKQLRSRMVVPESSDDSEDMTTLEETLLASGEVTANGTNGKLLQLKRQRRRIKQNSTDQSAAVHLHSMRVKPSAAFALYPGSRFIGEQRSDKASYTVAVQIQHVDFKQSQICGYLTIKDLTPEFPELTTYFEAEIIGPRYSFLTRKWEADEAIDRQHWSRFPAFQQYGQHFNRDDYVHSFENKDHIFMRWKVPDHRIKNVNGASFAGFYYVCFDSVSQNITGYYYHQNSEWFQHLVLAHVPEKSFDSFEFR